MKRFNKIISILLGITLLASWLGIAPLTASGANPPDVPKIDRPVKIHHDLRLDPYYWLRNREDPEVVKYLQRENQYTAEIMKPTLRLQDKLYQEMVGRIKQNDLSVPDKIGNFYYYGRTEQGKDYPIFCRKQGSLQAAEEILLDVNMLAQGQANFNLGGISISPNHKLLAYCFDTDGSENYTIVIKNLQTGRLLQDKVSKAAASIQWAKDNKTLFYLKLDDAKRPCKLFRHSLGSEPSKDLLLYEEKDEAFHVSLSRSGSGEYLLLDLQSKDSSEVRYLNLNEPQGKLQVIQSRKPRVIYLVDHNGGYFYAATNEKAENFKLMKLARAESGERWQEIIPRRKDVTIEDFRVFRNELVVLERAKGLQHIRIINLKNGREQQVDFPEPAFQLSLAERQDYDGHLLRFTYSSLVCPSTIYEYDMLKGTRKLLKQEAVAGYKPELYKSERISARAADGTEIPISLVYKKGVKFAGTAPLLLTGYGAYGYSYPVSFNSNRLSLLNRGFIIAIAHIRGGQEMGRSWYEQGKLLNKKNTFTDFIACAEHLIDKNYTDSSKLVILGGSAGGLLMGAVTNMRPDLFRVVIAQVPFVDVLNTMSDPSLPLTVTEYEEWGNPADETFYQYIKSYSPYDNVGKKEYPNILVTAGLNDPWVSYWEPAKWVARLRDYKTDNNLLLLKVNMAGGHFGSGGRYEQLKEAAFAYAFMFKCLGIEK